MSPLRLAAAALALALFCGALPGGGTRAVAADANGKFAIKGIGLASCQRFNEERAKKSNDYLIIAGWFVGFLTAMNQHAPNTYDIAGWESEDTLLAYLANFCQQKPEMEFIRAVEELAKALAPTRLVEGSDLKVVRAEDKQLVIYVSVLQSVQDKLREKGYYTGESDGEFGPNLEAAFRAFQRDAGLNVTGLPDQPTLFRLLRNQQDKAAPQQ